MIDRPAAKTDGVWYEQSLIICIVKLFRMLVVDVDSVGQFAVGDWLSWNNCGKPAEPGKVHLFITV